MAVNTVKTYDIGDVVRCSGVFKSRVGVIFDPTTVFFSFIDPDGVETIYTYGVDDELQLDTDGTATPVEGSYYTDITTTISGMYKWRLYSTGVGKSAEEWQFYVAFSEFN